VRLRAAARYTLVPVAAFVDDFDAAFGIAHESAARIDLRPDVGVAQAVTDPRHGAHPSTQH